MAKIEIDPNQVLNPGDRVELHFKSIGMVWIKATQIYLIEKRLEGRKDFELVRTLTPSATEVIFVVDIKGGAPVAAQGLVVTGAAVITAAKIAAIIAALGIVYLTFSKAYLIVETVSESPAGQFGIVGMAAVAVIILLALVLKK